MPKDTKTLGNSKARACESLGFVHKKGCARVLTQPQFCHVFNLRSSLIMLFILHPPPTSIYCEAYQRKYD